MGRLSLKCPCGWVFFVSALTEADTVACPTCGEAIRLPKNRESAKPSGGVLPMIGLIAGIVVILGGALYFILSGGDEPASRPSASASSSSRRPDDAPPKSRGITAGAAATMSTRVPASTDAPAEPEPLPELETEAVRIDPYEIDRLILRLNVAGIVRNLLQTRGRTDQVTEVDDKMIALEGRIDDLSRRLARQGKPHAFPRYLKPGDQIVRIGTISLEQKTAAEAAQMLETFLRNQVREGTTIECAVLRTGEILTILLSWNEIPKESHVFFKMAGVPPPAGPATTDAAPPPAPVETAAKSKLAGDLLDRVRKTTQGIHPYWRRLLTPAERQRLDDLLKAGEGTPSDVTFLSERVLEQFAADVASEQATIEEQVVALGKTAVGASQSDMIEKADGTKLEGRVLEETPEGVKFERKVGNLKAIVTLKPEEIRKITRGAGAGNEFPERLKKAGTDAKALAALAAWCKESGLKDRADYAAWLALKQDPDQAEARKFLGFAKGEGDRWVREEALQMQAGKFLYLGNWYTREDFEKKLAAQGNAKIEGKWYTRQRWTYEIGNLYDDGARLDAALEGAGISDIVEVKKEKKFDILKKEYVDNEVRVTTGRCIGFLVPKKEGPVVTTYTGTARVRIRAPMPFLACRVRALGRVVSPAASLAVSVAAPGGGEPDRLYTLTGGSGTASDDRLHDVSKTVFGRPEFYIEAVMTGGVEAAGVLGAQFLPSNRSDQGVLRVVGDIAKPMDAVNKLLGLTGAAAAAAGTDPSAPAPAVADPGSAPAPTPSSSPTDPPPPGGAADASGDAKAVAEVDKIVEEILRTNPAFTYGVTKLQQGTTDLRYSKLPDFPEEFKPVTRNITDPLLFQPAALTADAAMEIGAWWDRTPPEGRRKFLRFFGLWCASRRTAR